MFTMFTVTKGASVGLALSAKSENAGESQGALIDARLITDVEL